jgi:hypothetical protein
MSKRLIVIPACFLALCSLGAGVRAQTASAAPPKVPLRMTAWAVNMSNIATGANATIELRVTRWSTAQEREAFITTFLDKGQDALLQALQKSRGIGRMRYPGATGTSAQRSGSASARAGAASSSGLNSRATAAASAAEEAQRQMVLGYDIRYAWHTPLEDGGDRMVLAFDRYVTFAEAVERPRVNDYPFTFIEIHLPKGGGQGEGKLSIATKLNFDKKKNSVEFENYSSEPVRLQQVALQK